MTVRADDMVPVAYVAGDDFGVASVEAIVQVDDHPAQTHQLHFTSKDRRLINGTYSLNIASLLKQNRRRMGSRSVTSSRRRTTGTRIRSRRCRRSRS